MPTRPPWVSISSTKMSRSGAARMPAAGAVPFQGTCRRLVRSSTMVVGVVIRRISRVFRQL